MDLAGRLDKVLQMSASEEVPQVDEFTVVLILHIDNTPAVLTSANLLAIDDDGAFATHNSKGNDVLDRR